MISELRSKLEEKSFRLTHYDHADEVTPAAFLSFVNEVLKDVTEIHEDKSNGVTWEDLEEVEKERDNLEDERDDAFEEIDKLKDETVSLKEEIDQLKEELKSYEVKSVPPSAPSHLNQGRGRLHLIGPKDVF